MYISSGCKHVWFLLVARRWSVPVNTCRVFTFFPGAGMFFSHEAFKILLASPCFFLVSFLVYFLRW